MATVRHKVMEEAQKIEGEPHGTIEKIDLPVPKPFIEVLDFVEEKSEGVNLADADIIVSAGRGIKDPKNIALIERLAKAVGGAVGASRAVVDAGWVPYSHQVGQTGENGQPGGLHRLRYLRCDSTPCRYEELGCHHCHQQRPERPDF